MSFMVVLVVDDIEKCPEVLDAWETAGVPGVTIIKSTGLGRIRKTGLRDDLPLFPNLSDLLEEEEVQHRTLISVVESQELVDRLVQGAERVIGDLDEPNTGFMFVVPVSQVFGYGKHRASR